MTSVLGLSLPKFGISKDDLTSPKNLALGGIATTSLIGGGVLGAIKGSPLKGLGIGAAVAAVALGAALLGNNGASQRDGFCDYYNDPDCDYPGTHGPRYDPPYYEPPYYEPDPYYPDPGYPSGGTSHGDDF